MELENSFDSILLKIDNLALATAQESAFVHQRLDRHEERLNNIEAEMKAMRNDMDEGFRVMNEGFRLMAESFQQIRDDIAAMNYGAEIRNLKTRVTRVEKKVGLAG